MELDLALATLDDMALCTSRVRRAIRRRYSDAPFSFVQALLKIASTADPSRE